MGNEERDLIEFSWAMKTPCPTMRKFCHRFCRIPSILSRALQRFYSISMTQSGLDPPSPQLFGKVVASYWSISYTSSKLRGLAGQHGFLVLTLICLRKCFYMSLLNWYGMRYKTKRKRPLRCSRCTWLSSRDNCCETIRPSSNTSRCSILRISLKIWSLFISTGCWRSPMSLIPSATTEGPRLSHSCFASRTVYQGTRYLPDG